MLHVTFKCAPPAPTGSFGPRRVLGYFQPFRVAYSCHSGHLLWRSVEDQTSSPGVSDRAYMTTQTLSLSRLVVRALASTPPDAFPDGHP